MCFFSKNLRRREVLEPQLGWKVFHWRRRTSWSPALLLRDPAARFEKGSRLVSPHSGFLWRRGRWMRAEWEGRPVRPSLAAVTIRAKWGFHIFLTYEDAEAYGHLFAYGSFVLPVKFKGTCIFAESPQGMRGVRSQWCRVLPRSEAPERLRCAATAT